MSKIVYPPQPGEILADKVLREDGGISVTAFAAKLGMTRTAIAPERSRLRKLRCHQGYRGRAVLLLLVCRFTRANLTRTL